MKITATVLCFLMVINGCSTGKLHQSPTGLQYRVLQKGHGPKALPGQQILLRETTSYRNGTVLYSNENKGNPVPVTIGAGQATLAVDEALRGMRQGEIKEIIAPPHLVKRTFYPANTHPDSTLVIKLLLQQIVH
jgi:FKBP-type peptidyl-prolyl cis-trans isomerase